MIRFSCFIVLLLSISFIQPLQSWADLLAVAAGIAPCVEEIMQAYINQGGEAMEMAKGPCGSLARQMAAGAPYELLLMSEPRWPNWLKSKGLLPEPTAFARGQLVLWQSKAIPMKMPMKIAVPEPETTAYGMLAKMHLIQEGLWQDAMDEKRIIFVGSAPQAVLAVRYGAADAAFIPQSMGIKAGGSYKIIPGAVIDQVGGLTQKAGNNARKFWKFCRSPQAASIWNKWGFTQARTE